MGSVNIEVSPCEKMGSVRILGILLDLFSLRINPNLWEIYIFLVWPKLAFVWGHITVKFTVVCISTYVRNVYVRTVFYYLFMRT